MKNKIQTMEPEYKQLLENFKTYLNEYGNVGPSTPKVYKIYKNKKIEEIKLSDVASIPNLIYDFGGGETSYYDDKNVVIIDNIPVKEFVESPGDIKGYKIYIEFNLSNYYNFPKADEVIISQLVFYINDLVTFSKTINNSLKPTGKINFFSSLMNKNDKEFIKILIDEYKFYLPLDISLNELNLYKSEEIILTRLPQKEQPIPPQKFEVEDTKTKKRGIISYVWDKDGWLETIEGDINKNDFYDKGKPFKWAGSKQEKLQEPMFIVSSEDKDYEENPWYWEKGSYPGRRNYKFIKKL